MNQTYPLEKAGEAQADLGGRRTTGSLEADRAKAAAAPDWGLLGVIGVGLCYGLAYSLLRLAISDNLPQDDVTSNILTQTLQLGYVPRSRRSTSGCYGWCSV